MKKLFKHVVPVFMAAIMTISGSTVAEAKTIRNPQQIVTVYSSASRSYNESQRKYTSANETILQTGLMYSASIKNVKSSNKAVVSTTTKKSYSSMILKGGEYTGTYLKVKKPGTATISFKLGKNVYKQKIVAMKYVNPFSSLKLNNKEVSSKFKTKAVYKLSYKKFRNKNVKLECTAKGDWTVSGIKYLKNPKQPYKAKWVGNSNFKITKKNSAAIIYMFNTKTKQEEQCLILFQ